MTPSYPPPPVEISVPETLLKREGAEIKLKSISNGQCEVFYREAHARLWEYFVGTQEGAQAFVNDIAQRLKANA